MGGSTAAAAEAADDAAAATSAAAAAAASAFLVIASTFRNIANVVTACRQTYYLGTLNKICIKNYYKVLTSALRSIWSLVSPKTYQAQVPFFFI